MNWGGINGMSMNAVASQSSCTSMKRLETYLRSTRQPSAPVCFRVSIRNTLDGMNGWIRPLMQYSTTNSTTILIALKTSHHLINYALQYNCACLPFAPSEYLSPTNSFGLAWLDVSAADCAALLVRRYNEAKQAPKLQQDSQGLITCF
jgi:hypothetical protein